MVLAARWCASFSCAFENAVSFLNSGRLRPVGPNLGGSGRRDAPLARFPLRESEWRRRGPFGGNPQAACQAKAATSESKGGHRLRLRYRRWPNYSG